ALAAIEVSLNDQPKVLVTFFMHNSVKTKCAIDAARIFHVDTDKESEGLSRMQDDAQILFAKLLIHLQTDLRERQREPGFYATPSYFLQDPSDLAGCLPCFCSFTGVL